ncbi:MAG TPA: sigma-70 family RNA polymerase sigma factor [Vineibacter sp.]|nr:sigma-70 family RNA polymerase sigma factor [Vineibacter sp.]
MAMALARAAQPDWGLLVPGWTVMTLRLPEAPPAEPPVADPEAASLVERVAVARDRAAFAALFRLFAPRVKAFLARTGTDAGLAEEIAQETLITVWRKAATFDRRRAAVSTWIFTIARNKRIDLARQAGRMRLDADEYALMATEPPPAADRGALDNETGRRVRDLMSTLPAEHIELIRMAYFEDKSHSTIASELRLPLGTVKSRIRLALQRLRATLEGEP